MGSEYFYQNLKSFPRYSQVAEDVGFAQLPQDWSILVADIKGSTKAIESGRYKDVNTIGAAVIVAATKGMNNLEFPFVFGGDGASLAAPPDRAMAVAEEISYLKALAKAQFGLELRVGMVKISELKGARVLVAKLELTGGKCIAVFKGGGLNLAEEMIKADEIKYAPPSLANGEPELSGLSCRWNPIPNKRGQILSMIAQARGRNKEFVYKEILEDLNKIFDGRLEEANPVNIDQASYKSFSDCVKNEKRLHQSVWSLKFFLRLAEIAFAVMVFKFKMPPLLFNPKRYADSMRPHSDFRKFDDMLRMIIDCSPEQSKQIQNCLEKHRLAGNIFYGLHESQNCLMTCFVGGLGDGEHIHFIDGGDGGYAMAAKQMKSQAAEEEVA